MKTRVNVTLPKIFTSDIDVRICTDESLSTEHVSAVELLLMCSRWQHYIIISMNILEPVVVNR